MQQGGIVDAIQQSILSLPIDLREPACANIVLTGGNAMLPGMATRVENSLRSCLPETLSNQLNVVTLDQPAESAWRGGSLLACRNDFSKYTVTKLEYEECGHNLARTKLFN